jgi:hypothetical protein
MRVPSLVGASILATYLSTIVIAEGLDAQSKEIPLDQVWGYNLPGTRDIAGIPIPETDPQEGVVGRNYEQFKQQRESAIEQMRRALMTKPPTERTSQALILARQPDFFTLQKASTFVAGLQHGKVKLTTGNYTVRAGEQATLIFFSHPSSYYVRLRKVEQVENEITVRYQFEPHGSPEVTVHFALIPLGELPVGEYQVRFEQIPLAEEYREAGFQPVEPDALAIVCRPLSFTVWEPMEVSPTKGATLIPLWEIWGYRIRGTRDVRELEPNADPN